MTPHLRVAGVRPTGPLAFRWVPRLVLLAGLAFGMLASVRVARGEGETELQEQRAPGEEEIEEANASALRSHPRRLMRGGAVERAFGPIRAPQALAAPRTPEGVRGQVMLPRRAGPPDCDDDDRA